MHLPARQIFQHITHWLRDCAKKDNLFGASKVLKIMMERGFLPTMTKYNYFFWFSPSMEESMWVCIFTQKIYHLNMFWTSLLTSY